MVGPAHVQARAGPHVLRCTPPVLSDHQVLVWPAFVANAGPDGVAITYGRLAWTVPDYSMVCR